MISNSFPRVVPFLLVLTSLTVICNVAAAHDSRPLYIELRELAPHQFELDLKVPPNVPLAVAPQAELSSTCALRGRVAERRFDGGWLRQSVYDCPDGIDGNTLNLRYPVGPVQIPVLARLERQSGEWHLEALPVGAETWLVPTAETPSRIARSYSLLGFWHVLEGYDHLLFLLCLIWISGTLKRTLLTVTGFTVAHSATLILSALDIVKLPVAPVEAVIALSILFLARELVKTRRDSLTWRYPVAVSTVFGLVHGLGFASALVEAGLPQVELVRGLLFFNIGVEIGQVLVVSAIAAAIAIGSGLQASPQRAAVLNATRVSASYLVGATASLWLIERCLAF